MNFLETRTKVIKHELGHWLVAKHVGFRTGDIEIAILLESDKAGQKKYTQNGSSMVYPAPVINNTNDLKDYLEKRFQVLYAGIAAQMHGLEMTPEESGRTIEMDAGGDLRIIRELAPLLRGMIYGEEIDPQTTEEQIYKMLNTPWERTQALIAEFHPKINWMANKLSPQIPRNGVKYVFPAEQIESLENQFQAEEARKQVATAVAES